MNNSNIVNKLEKIIEVFFNLTLTRLIFVFIIVTSLLLFFFMTNLVPVHSNSILVITLLGISGLMLSFSGNFRLKEVSEFMAVLLVICYLYWMFVVGLFYFFLH